MKIRRTIILIFTIILCVSCSSQDDDVDIQNWESLDSYQTYCDNETGTRVCVALKTDENTEDYNLYMDSKSASFFDVSEFQDVSAPATRKITFLDKEYLGEYENSALLPLSGQKVHVYLIQEPSIKNSNTIRFFVDATTNSVVKYVNFPLNAEKFTEEEHVELIQKLIGGKYPLSNYEYACQTHYYIHGDKSFQSSLENKFHVPTNNETLGAYYFYFNKYIGDVQLLDHVSAIIRDNSITLELVDQNYDLSIFDKLTIMKNVYYNAAESVIKSNLRDTVKISNISSNYSKFFIRNGVPFVVITSSIDYSLEGNSTTHTALATTICWLEMGNNNS